MAKRSAAYWVERLGLVEHPEGGFFRETYRADGSVPGRSGDHPAGRSFSTAIYFLLRSGDVSRLHRLRSDEVFHYYSGSPLTLHVIDPEGLVETILLGDDPERDHVLQTVVRAGCWFGATVDERGAYSLVGCTVAPGFEFDDFELADREWLSSRHPEHRRLIERLT